MKELEILLNRRWILKSEDKELYYRVRDAVGEIRKYVTDKLGCQIIDNSLLIKLERYRSSRSSLWELASSLRKKNMCICVFY